MTIDMSQFFQVFFEETAEHLASMESLLLGLDLAAPSLEDLNAIFRAAHSIKGGSGTFGFTDMTEVTHILETLLDRLRKQELGLRPDMLDAFLAAGDVLRAQLEHHQGGPAADPGQISRICATLAALAADPAAPTAAATAAAKPGAATHGRERRLRLECRLNPEAAADQQGVANLLAALAELANHEVLHQPSGGDPRLVVRLVTRHGDAELKDVFSFHASPEAIDIAPEDAEAGYGFFEPLPATAAADPGYGFFDTEPAALPFSQDPGYGLFEAEALAGSETGYGFFDTAPGAPPALVTAAAVPTCEEGEGYGLFEGAPGTQAAAPLAQPAAAVTASTPEATAAAVTAQSAEGTQAKAAAGETSSIRVAVEKVDQLINLVGELVITQAMLAEAASHLDPIQAEKLLSGIDLLARNTRDLQESVMSIRMLPMSMVFSRFPRVVRDLAGKLGKQVELKTVGENTELDKGLIEKITDPLTHLVRNSLDHGIETPERRTGAGKNPKGTLTLKASHQGGNIVIEVMDDGGGLNRDRILAKAREKGMHVSDAMSDSEVWQLIMAPGFSTAEQITDVSGRGVGMDVVKKNIEGLGGKVELESSPGFGTRTLIRLPLTLAILDGMSVEVGGEIFIVPLTAIVESLQPRPDDIKTLAGDARVVHIRGEYLPLVSLADLFGIHALRDASQGLLVVVEAEQGRAALSVDALLGQHQVVIKSLEANYRKVPGVSGATIMGDGSVALILDVAAVCRLGRTSTPRRLAA